MDIQEYHKLKRGDRVALGKDIYTVKRAYDPRGHIYVNEPLPEGKFFIPHELAEVDEDIYCDCGRVHSTHIDCPYPADREATWREQEAAAEAEHGGIE